MKLEDVRGRAWVAAAAVAALLPIAAAGVALATSAATKIVFVRNDELVAISQTGRGLKVIVRGPAIAPGQTPAITDPAVSPNGQRVAFAWRPQGATYPLLAFVGVKGGPSGKTSTALATGRPSWSENGKRLAISLSVRCTSIDAHGCAAIAIANPSGHVTKTVVALPDTALLEPAWSPNGHTILFVQGDTFIGDYRGSIWAVSATGSGRHELIEGANADPVWSPSGRLIAYEHEVVTSRNPSDGTIEEHMVIFIANSKGTVLRSLTTSLAGNARTPSWSPDSKRLVFSYTPKGSTAVPNLYTIGADGKGLARLTDGSASDIDPSWQP